MVDDTLNQQYPIISAGQLTADLLIPLTTPDQPFDYFVSALDFISTGGVVYQNRAGAQADSISAAVQMIAVLAYATEGDLKGHGPMVFRRVASLPSSPGWIRTADRYLPNGTTDATNGGYWFLDNQTVTPQMFGCLSPDSAPGYDSAPSFTDMISYVENPVNAIAGAQNAHVSTKNVIFPAGFYYTTQTLKFRSVTKVRGEEYPSSSNVRCVIYLGDGADGLHVGYEIGDNPYYYAFGHEISGIYLRTANADTTGAFRPTIGIYVHCDCKISKMTIQGFSSHGLYIYTNEAVQPGSLANGTRIEDVMSIGNGGDGFRAIGPDSNACIFERCNGSFNGGSGFTDASFLGNTYVACHTNGNGNRATFTEAVYGGGPVCQYGGHVYGAVPSADNINNNYFSTTTPGTNEAVWFSIDGAPWVGLITWTTGRPWRLSYQYAISSASTLSGCYGEANGWPAYFGKQALILGNQIPDFSAGYYTSSAFRNVGVLYASPDGVKSGAFCATMPRTHGDTGSVAWKTTLGRANGEAEGTMRSAGLDQYPGYRYVEQFNETNYDWSFGAIGGGAGYLQGVLTGGDDITGGYSFGSPVLQRGVFTFGRIGFFNNPNGVGNRTRGNTPNIIIDADSAQPPNYAGGGANCGRGWYRFNTAASENSPSGWVCTTGGYATSAPKYRWVPASIAAPINEVTNTETSTTSLTISAAKVTGGRNTTFLEMTGALGGNSTLTLPTGTNLMPALPSGGWIGMTYLLVVSNRSANNFTWTIAANTDFSVSGTMTIPQNTWREFIVTITSLWYDVGDAQTATLTATGRTGTYS